MESLPREILNEITKCLSLSCVASLAQTSKSFNSSIWSLITTLDDEDSKNIKESTRLDKFNNLEYLSFRYSDTIIPQDLSKLTNLQKLDANIDLGQREAIECLFNVIPTLTNLRELTVCFPKFSEKHDLLADHTRLTRLEISAQNYQKLDPFSWEIMTRLRYLRLYSPYDSDNYSYGKISSGFLSTLWTLTQLRGLDLSRIILDQQGMETGLSKLTNVEVLSIYACTLREEDNSEWMINYNELLDLKKLTNLEIMDVKLNDKLIDIIANMTQLMRLDIMEFVGEYALSPYSNLKNLTKAWFSVDILESDPGLEFNQMPNLEALSVPWCTKVTQLVHLKKLRDLSLQKGSHKNYEQVLNFLNELDTLQDLTLSYELLPSDGIVNMKGMTNLTHVTIDTPVDDAETKSTWESVRKFAQGLSSLPSLVSLRIDGDITRELLQTEFVQGLSVLPSLVSLSINESISRELFEIIVTSLTQLQTLKLRNRGRYLFKDDPDTQSDLPSPKDFNFRIEFTKY